MSVGFTTAAFSEVAGSSPEEPFRATTSAQAASPAENPVSDDVESDPGEETSGPTRTKSDKFSLWDFFSNFFEIGASKNPNQLDKLRLTVGPTLGYDSNVFTTHTDQIASGTAGLNGTVAYNFGSERLKIASALALGVTYYDNRPGDDTDYNGTFSLSTSYFVTRRLQVLADTAFAYLSQPSPTLIGGVSRFSGDYTTLNFGLGVNYTLRPRLSFRLQYRYSSVQYTDATINNNQGFQDQTYVLGLDYLLHPRLTLSAEYRYNPLSYEAANQDSNGQIFTLGFTAAFSPKLKWTLQAGAELRMLNNTTQTEGPSQYAGPFLETNLEYNFAPGSSVIGGLRYGTEPSGSAGISIRQTLRGSLGLHHAFAARLSGDVSISYEHDRYDQPGDANDFTQEYYTAGIGLRYQFNPAFAATIRYDYSAVQADEESAEYIRGVTTFGLEIIF